MRTSAREDSVAAESLALFFRNTTGGAIDQGRSSEDLFEFLGHKVASDAAAVDIGYSNSKQELPFCSERKLTAKNPTITFRESRDF